MEINIGKNLKKLRVQRDLTQEQLAEILNVSAQAISRWENNTTYPDIATVPFIANFFDVSVDELIGMDEIRNSINMNEIFPKVHELRSLGQIEDAIILLREAMKVYPNNNGVLAELAMTLTLKNNEETDNGSVREAIQLSERVLENSTSTKLRSCVMANLCFLYLKDENQEKAISLVRTLPHIWECRELLLSEMYSDNEYAIELRKSIHKLLSVICAKINNMKNRKYSNPDNILAEGVDFEAFGDINNKVNLILKFFSDIK
ncbi:MAG TPA: transcriptional regulator [Clostridiales bacterium]|nr:transcriptional regulator [Clostridiales bacterium]